MPPSARDPFLDPDMEAPTRRTTEHSGPTSKDNERSTLGDSAEKTTSRAGHDTLNTLRRQAADEPAMTAEQRREVYQQIRAESQAEAIAYQREARERARRARHEKALERTAIPRKYRGLGFEGYHAELTEEQFVRDAAQDYAETFRSGSPGLNGHSPNLILMGGSRCGKTHLACAVAESVMADHTAVVVKLSTILVECREVYRNEHLTDREVLNRYIEPDLLIIDEVGEDETGSAEYRQHKIGYIIDERVENLRPTVVVGNVNDKGLEDYLGFRTYNRLVEHCLPALVFDWTPYWRRHDPMDAVDPRAATNPAAQNASSASEDESDDPFGTTPTGQVIRLRGTLEPGPGG